MAAIQRQYIVNGNQRLNVDGADESGGAYTDILVTCVCGTATTWVCMNQSTNGTVSATEAAA